MKTSLSKLPEYARLDLEQIVGLILENVPRCEMIILYGSYARGTQVEFDERIEFGIPTSFMSDYDILVVTECERCKGSRTDARCGGYEILQTSRSPGSYPIH